MTSVDGHRVYRIALLLVGWLAFACVCSAAGETPAADASFDLLEFRVEGNSVLEAIQIERAVYPFLGPSRTIADVDKARTALEKAYHDAGYLTVYVDVPEQEVKAGVVTLAVTEATVDRLRVRGAKYFSAGRIQAGAPAVAEGEVPNFQQLQQDLAQLGRSADRKVTPVLKASAIPGRVDVDLNVQDERPLHGAIELNNRYSPNTDPLRLVGAIRYDNLWQREHSASLQYLLSPQDPSQVRVLSGSYVFKPGQGNNVLALYAVRSKSNVAATADLAVLGAGLYLGTRYIVPLPAKGAYTHSFTLGVDYKDLSDSVTLLGSDTVTTPISYVPFSAQYSAAKTGARGTTQGNLAVNFTIRDAFGNNDSEFANRRYGALANYIYLRGELSRDQKLPRGYSMFVRVGGQAASQPLISSEQFFAGGLDTVRGYLEAEALGDQGVTFRIEVRTPSFAESVGSVVEVLAAHAFVDAAQLRIQDPLPGQKVQARLSSAGVGLRANGPRNLVATADVGWPFESTTYTAAGDPRLTFRLAYAF